MKLLQEFSKDIYKKISLKDLEEMFLKEKENNNVGHYKKFGVFKYRKAKIGEKIDTIIHGKKETQNVSKENSWILTGSEGEDYIIDDKTFKKRYEIIDDKTAKSIGECWAFKNKENLKFIASWGEEMIANPGDMIASTDKNGSKPYRIEKNVFKRTYKKV
ncbi:MAG: hypothetical protein QXG00_04615 [Candidatus Woesearchaeota archaeon]